MRILWLTNIPLPYAVDSLRTNYVGSGSWLGAMAENLVHYHKDIVLYILSPLQSIDNEIRIRENEQITHILFKPQNDNHELFKYEITSIRPDIVHIHGTEFRYSRELIDICDVNHCVVSIQGLLSSISNSYKIDFDWDQTVIPWYKRIFIHDYKRTDFLQHVFNLGEIDENYTLQKAKYVIGRTDWDHNKVSSINNNIVYFKVNETLRSIFYSGKTWKYADCEKHSLFFSQVHYPIKGFHQFLKIAGKIKKRYPDLKIYLSGYKPYTKGLKSIKYDTEYQSYLKALAIKNKVYSSITALGMLDAEKMEQRMLLSNVFVSCSSIENESNSISEAKILGVPVIASLVGGVVDRTENGKDSIGYRYNDLEKLYDDICYLFDNPVEAEKIGRYASLKMNRICDRKRNSDELYLVYKTVVQGLEN